MSVQFLIYIPVLISLFAISIFIFSRNLQSRINLFFGLFTSMLFLWLSGLFLADTSTTDARALIGVRLAIFFACLIPLFFLWFSMVFPNEAKQPWRKLLPLALPGVALMLVSWTDLMVQEVQLKEYVAEPTTVGAAYTIFLIYLVGYFLASFIILIRKLKHSSLAEKSQIKYVLSGTVIGVATNVAFNFIFVILGLSGIALLLGGPSILVFALIVTYAIVKHRLFDIRLVVARTVAYLLLLAALGSLYAATIFAFSTLFFDTNEVNATEQLFNVTAAIFLALTFQPLKKFFDRISNKLFYRDAYDPQAFLDQLNKVLVANVDLGSLLKQVNTILESNLKATFSTFAIKETENLPRQMIGQIHKEFADEDIEVVRKTVPHIQKLVIMTDDLGEEQQTLKSLLRKHDISALVRLTPSIRSTTSGVGQLLLGPKRSGNPFNSKDIRILEIIANELVIAIQNALRFAEIQQFNITLQEKVDDATRRLRSTNEKLKALDETKDEFISMASHQLRTPLTSVKGYISMVMEGDAGKISASQRKLLDQAFVSSQRMVYLIADLLNVSRLRTGKFVIEAKPTNLAELVEGEIGQLKETAAGRSLELTYDKPKEFTSLMLDETKIRQVVMNFVDNAIYYTPAGGHINVKVSETPEAIEFTVTDDGLGVPKAEQHHLFSKFYRAGNAKKARPDGTGLGLFMAKKVIIAQGGSIIFSSTEGKGSTFGFHFGKAKLAVPAHIKSQ